MSVDMVIDLKKNFPLWLAPCTRYAGIYIRALAQNTRRFATRRIDVIDRTVSKHDADLAEQVANWRVASAGIASVSTRRQSADGPSDDHS